jgi:hypothetical protein
MKQLLPILALLGSSGAFAPLQMHGRSVNKRFTSMTNDEAIEELSKEYRLLQNSLFEVLQEKPRRKKQVDEITETMYEIAEEVNSLKRYKQMEKIVNAENDYKHALGDLEKAEGIKAQYRMTGGMAEEEASLIEADIDVEYDDTERRRDMSVVHAAKHLQEDADHLIVEAELHEFKAEIEFEDAIKVLQELEANEKLLKDTLQEIRKEHHQETAMTHFLEKSKPKHEKFLKKAREVVKKYGGKLIDHDPFKGKVGF